VADSSGQALCRETGELQHPLIAPEIPAANKIAIVSKGWSCDSHGTPMAGAAIERQPRAMLPMKLTERTSMNETLRSTVPAEHDRRAGNGTAKRPSKRTRKTAPTKQQAAHQVRE
jgi:hypothetical protein